MSVMIEANTPFIRPPDWAVLQRSLLERMSEAVQPLLARYVRADGEVMWPTTEEFCSIDGLDDAYESFHNWPVLYALGGADDLQALSQRQWEAITRQFTRYDSGHGHPMVVKEFEQGYDWMHQGEGHLLLYGLGLSDPGHEENVERARRFAGFYLNEDPAALNYDPEQRIIKCAHNGSMGPAQRNFERFYTVYRYRQWKPWPLPFHDLPGIASVEDLQKPGMEEAMGQALVQRMSRGDVAANLAVTSLVTHAYLHTGDEKYRAWVQEYTESWMERTLENGGIMPDNIGLSGRVGEYLDGKWYGGYYGWTWPHGWHHLSDSCISAAQNALLLTGDMGYMGFPRTQMEVLAGEARWEEGAGWRVPYFHHDGGWDGYTPMQARHTAHIWGATMDADDFGLGVELRDHARRDHERVIPSFSKHGGNHEAAWLAYLNGEFPDYPEQILRHNHGQLYQRLAFMAEDTQDPATYGDWYLQVRNPVFVEGLVQLAMGGPLPNYNGGLLHARLRYFDGQRRRPGLPPDVAALVEGMSDKKTVVQLVNLSPTQTRDVVVQGGVFGEHRLTGVTWGVRRRRGEPNSHWTEVQHRERIDGETAPQTVAVGDRALTVRLPPSTQTRLTLGMRRYANRPTYAPPW
jgi:hypothetical protein